jgi:hypothetical protein
VQLDQVLLDQALASQEGVYVLALVTLQLNHLRKVCGRKRGCEKEKTRAWAPASGIPCTAV